jgi:hypothetical protein
MDRDAEDALNMKVVMRLFSGAAGDNATEAQIQATVLDYFDRFQRLRFLSCAYKAPEGATRLEALLAARGIPTPAPKLGLS